MVILNKCNGFFKKRYKRSSREFEGGERMLKSNK